MATPALPVDGRMFHVEQVNGASNPEEDAQPGTRCAVGACDRPDSPATEIVSPTRWQVRDHRDSSGMLLPERPPGCQRSMPPRQGPGDSCRGALHCPGRGI